MFKHYNALIDELVLQGGQLRTGQELAALAASNTNKEGDVARALLQRSASLVATQFAGFYNFRNKPAKLTIIMQGGQVLARTKL